MLQYAFKVTTAGGKGGKSYSYCLLKHDKICYLDSRTANSSFTYTPYEKGDYNLIVYCTDVTGDKDTLVYKFTVS